MRARARARARASRGDAGLWAGMTLTLAGTIVLISSCSLLP